MMIPVDPIMALVAVVGVFVYCAFSGGPSPKKKGMSDEKFIKWFAEQEEKRKIERSPEKNRMSNEEFNKWYERLKVERSPENWRYQRWLYRHRENG